MRPFVIWSPPWDHRIGGIRALYALRDGLRSRGFTADLHTERTDPDAITVYPEIVRDNPLGATRIVRWRLNKATLPDDGLVFDWQPTGDGAPLLTFDLVDHELLARRDGPREGVAVVIRKGTADPARIPSGAVEITRTWPAQRQATVDLLASVDHVVSFDEFTMLNLEAVLLGTPVVLYPSGRWTRAEIEFIGLPPGICWRPDDIDAARDATRDAWPWHQAQANGYSALLDSFVEETQTRWPTSG